MATSMDEFNQWFEWACGRERRKDGTFDPAAPEMVRLDAMLQEMIGDCPQGIQFSVMAPRPHQNTEHLQLQEAVKNVMRAAWTGGHIHGEQHNAGGRLVIEALPALRVIEEFCRLVGTLAGTPGYVRLITALVEQFEVFARKPGPAVEEGPKY
jgi:hypothetical protein